MIAQAVIPQGSRYSEDIDLVQVKAESIGKTLDAIRRMGLSLKGVEPAKVVESFSAYMKHGGFEVSAKQYTENLEAKMKNELFVADSRALLNAGSD